MESLHALLHSMNRKETLLLEKYLKHISGRREMRRRCLRLYQVLMEQKEVSKVRGFYSVRVLGRPDPHKIKKVKRSVRELAYDVLVSGTDPDHRRDLSDANRAMIHIKKKSALFTRLFYSGIRLPLVSKLLDEIINEARLNEYYHVLVEHLRLRKWMKGLRQGSPAFRKVNTEIKYYLHCAVALDKAVDNYYAIAVVENEQAKPDKVKMDARLNRAIERTEADAESTGSANITYYLYLLHFAYFNLHHRHREAREMCLEITALLNDHPFLQRKERFSAIHGNIANCDIWLGNYAQAVKFARMAQEHEKQSHNLFASCENEFIACISGGDLKGARKALARLQLSTLKEVGAMKMAKGTYYEACLLFAEKKFSKARDLLLNYLEISSDKPGWETGIRILQILCFIELEADKLAADHMERLKRFMERSRHKGETISRRDRRILSLLVELEKTGFNFRRLGEKGRNILKSLQTQKGELAWEPFTSEVLRVDEWCASKVNVSSRAPS